MNIPCRGVAAWLSLVIGLVLATPAPAQGVEGKKYALGSFDAVVFNGTAGVRLVQGAEDSVFVEGDAETQEAVDLDVEGGVLRVRPSGSWKFWRGKQIQIVVTARDLRRLEIKGAADIVAAEPMRLKQLQVNISGAGSVRFDKLKAERLGFNVSGSGTGQLAGAVDELNVRISGRGVYLGENLVSQTASLAVSGAGEVRIWTTKELTAHVSGVATIDFWGGAKVSRSNSGLTTWNDHGDKRASN
jgi:Putative auto-transporter adhesin, head GIN domain